MPAIIIETSIWAPIETVFDLARSIDLHQLSVAHTNEKAIAGKTSGLIGLHESVTWQAKHFGLRLKLTSKITAYNRPDFFTDEMVAGPFASFRHEHHFNFKDGATLMKDVFMYKSPYGLLGRLADVLFLENYMTNLLTVRNKALKQIAEDPAQHKKILPQ